MRSRLAAATLCSALLAAAASVPPAHAAPLQRCGWVSFDPNPGEANDHGGDVRTAGMGCRSARIEVRKWVLTGRDHADRGWSCRIRDRQPSSGVGSTVTRCRKAHRTIRLVVGHL